MPIADRLARVAPSATMAAGEQARRLRAQGLDVIDLGPGEPDFPTPEHICEAARRALEAGHTRYTAAGGIPELREAVARRWADRYGVDYSPAETIITCGGKHALYGAIQSLVGPGDEVIVPSPYWVSFPEQVRLAGGTPVFVDAAEEDGFVVHPEALEAACSDRTRAIILNSPCNPTGAVLPREVVTAVARLALDRGLLLIYDECYERFLYDGATHASPLELGAEAKEACVICGSCSKAYAMTGWRLGYALGPRKVIDAMIRLQSHAVSHPCSISQWAALAALTGDQGPVERMVAAFAERRRLLLRGLARCPGVRCVAPRGAFYAFPNVSALLSERLPTAEELAARLLDRTQVVTVPGTAFGRDGYLRLSFAVPSERLRQALERLEEALTALAA